MTASSRWALSLAVGATGTALCLSVLAGWQRGGTLAERCAWVAIGMVLVTSAHLLPALLRDTSIPVRIAGTLLWLACMAAACYGHTTFFLLAQQHAGERRAASVPTTSISEPVRSMTVVMVERAAVTHQLALAQMHRCPHDCSTLEARRVTLAAKLEALDAEADDIRRRDAADDRVTASQESLRADPVTSRLAALLGTTVTRIDLGSALMFAAVLEGIACLLWTVALPSSPIPARESVLTSHEVMPQTEPARSAPPAMESAVTTTSSGQASESVGSKTETGSRAYRSDPHTGPMDDILSRLAQEIEAGRVRPTVAGIRQHLGCSQTRAAALRKRLITSSP
ncbi:hypothetical protein [Paraburkholderia sp. BCC1885]|uniref:hypothetical protein n=1 Tax=Paraburkholderia sp. BCC1885 TaxID=2562669 RepID=UPI001181D851|nr:hypothetical protein [Paraburkholderia sp. BCC1885]